MFNTFSYVSLPSKYVFCPIQVLCLFLNQVVFLSLSCRTSSYILAINLFSDTWFANIFSHFVGCLFTLLIFVLWCTEVFFFFFFFFFFLTAPTAERSSQARDWTIDWTRDSATSLTARQGTPYFDIYNLCIFFFCWLRIWFHTPEVIAKSSIIKLFPYVLRLLEF